MSSIVSSSHTYIVSIDFVNILDILISLFFAVILFYDQATGYDWIGKLVVEFEKKSRINQNTLPIMYCSSLHHGFSKSDVLHGVGVSGGTCRNRPSGRYGMEMFFTGSTKVFTSPVDLLNQCEIDIPAFFSSGWISSPGFWAINGVILNTLS